MKKTISTAYISNYDAIIDLQGVYNKIATLYLGDRHSEICNIPKEFTQEFCNYVTQKDFEKKIVVTFYDHQVKNKQQLINLLKKQCFLINLKRQKRTII